MIRSRSFVVTCVLAASCAGLGTIPAHAGRQTYLLHVQGRLGEGSRVLDLAVPWRTSKGGSPFDFTADVADDVGLDRLRKAWGALQRLPEGRAVTIETSCETIRAWRRGGYLVLEPHRGEETGVARVKIPDYIVTTILAHDGRLTDEDIDRLVRERGKVTLVKVNSEKGALSVWVDRSTGDL
jgi:hypothetical protein